MTLPPRNEPPSEADQPGDSPSAGLEDDARQQTTEKKGLARFFPGLSWAFALSTVLHLAFVVPVVLFATVDSDKTMSLEWMDSLDSLTAIGHGMDRGTWAELKEVPEVEAEPEAEPEEVLPEEPAEPQEPVELPEPEPVVAEKEKPAPAKKPEKAEKPQKTDESEKPEKTEKPEKPAKKPAGALADGEPLPGLNPGGPSNLPDLKGYGPGNARFTALIRLDRLRAAAYADNLRRVFEAVPDYRILLESTDIDPMRDLDSIFMASANPQYLQETFLAVRHRMDDATLKKVLDSRFADEVPWEKRGKYEIRALVPSTGRYQDPRQILLARPGLSLVTRPEWVKSLTEDNVAGESISMLDGLQHIERAAEGDDTLLVISAQGLYFVLPGMGRVPRFEAARLAVTKPQNPLLTIDLRFADEAQAKRFHERCPTMKQQVIKGIPFARALGIATLVERAECNLEGEYVTVRGQYTHREVSNLLQLALPFIPRPPALTGLPPAPAPPPPPEPEVVEAEADAGVESGGNE